MSEEQGLINKFIQVQCKVVYDFKQETNRTCVWDLQDFLKGLPTDAFVTPVIQKTEHSFLEVIGLVVTWTEEKEVWVQP